MDLPITFKGMVYPWQLDHMGHFNVQFYVAMFDQSTWALLASVGLTASFFTRERRRMAAVEQKITYRQELFPGDLVENRSGIVEVRDKVIRIFHDMRLAETGVLAARAELVTVFVDADAGRATVLPADIRDRARALLVIPESL
ncbi:MAG: thioesterase [Telmatospirillum sp.]|nr:thioesterase [Telmatospirillum sp.]